MSLGRELLLFPASSVCICLQEYPGQSVRAGALVLARGTVVGKEAGEEQLTCPQPHIMLS